MEQLPVELAKYGLSGIAILLVLLVGWLVKNFLDFIAKATASNDLRHDKFIEAVNANTEVTKETYQYLKMRNGSIERAIREAAEIKNES